MSSHVVTTPTTCPLRSRTTSDIKWQEKVDPSLRTLTVSRRQLVIRASSALLSGFATPPGANTCTSFPTSSSTV